MAVEILSFSFIMHRIEGKRASERVNMCVYAYESGEEVWFYFEIKKNKEKNCF